MTFTNHQPQSFLYLMSLRTGTEMIALGMLFNKMTGVYGLLAILTGLHLSPTQLSMYLYSIVAVGVLGYLMPHIRKASPFQCLALAWFYIFDTIINTAYTAAFAVTWFLAISASQGDKAVPAAPGSGTIDDTAGFTSPKYNVSKVDVIATPASGIAGGQDAVALGTAAAAAAVAGSPGVGHGVQLAESVPSIMFIVGLSLMRIYFILVIMAYARQVLRANMYSTDPSRLHLHTDGTMDAPTEDPFDEDSARGRGWKGKLGRIMVSTGKSYWLGGAQDEEWTRGMDGRFKSSRVDPGPPGTLERERRARSGTGPPLPSPHLLKG
jgi:hypothetical protein